MNYPNGIKKQTNTDKLTTNINYKNRGMTLEAELNSSNEYYRKIDKAFIYKKPTPIKITKEDYPSRDKTIIKEASQFHQQQTITGYTMENILILKPKKQRVKPHFL